LPVEVVLTDKEVQVEDEQVVLVLVEEMRVDSVLDLPTDIDVRKEEEIDEHVPNRESHPVPQHPVELPQYYSRSKLVSIVQITALYLHHPCCSTSRR
jgi:hypothetical protein